MDSSQKTNMEVSVPWQLILSSLFWMAVLLWKIQSQKQLSIVSLSSRHTKQVALPFSYCKTLKVDVSDQLVETRFVYGCVYICIFKHMLLIYQAYILLDPRTEQNITIEEARPCLQFF